MGHLPLEERYAVNVDHPSSFDDDLFVAHVRSLVAGEAIDTPSYDYKTFTRVDGADRVEPRPVVLIEGILLFASPRIRDLVDVKVLEFVEPSKRWADVIVPRGVENVVGVDLVTTRVESLLALA